MALTLERCSMSSIEKGTRRERDAKSGDRGRYRVIGREDDDGDDTSEDDDASGGDVEMALSLARNTRGSPDSHKADSNGLKRLLRPLPGGNRIKN